MGGPFADPARPAATLAPVPRQGPRYPKLDGPLAALASWNASGPAYESGIDRCLTAGGQLLPGIAPARLQPPSWRGRSSSSLHPKGRHGRHWPRGRNVRRPGISGRPMNSTPRAIAGAANGRCSAGFIWENRGMPRPLASTKEYDACRIRETAPISALRQNSGPPPTRLRGHMDAAEYKHVVLGLIFLKYISDAFEEQHAELEAERPKDADPEDPRRIPRRERLLGADGGPLASSAGRTPSSPTIGKIDRRRHGRHRARQSLAQGRAAQGLRPPGLDKQRLGELIDLIGNIGLGDQAAPLEGHARPRL